MPTSPLVGEDSKPRDAQQSGSARLVRATDAGDELKPIKRGKIGAGRYEDPGEERQKKRPGKTGRPGR